MPARGIARGRAAARVSSCAFISYRAGLKRAASVVALAAAASLPGAVLAADYVVVDQAGFANAVNLATTTPGPNSVTISSAAPATPVYAPGGTVNFPGAGAPFTLNIGDRTWFQIGSPASGTQTLNIGPGTSIIVKPVTAVSRIQVGINGGTGTVNMTGGIVDIDDDDPGQYGTLDVGRGLGSVGVFNQSGGTVTAGGALQIGYEGATGTYNLTGGLLQLGERAGPHVYLGQGATGYGVLNISGTGHLLMDGTDWFDAGNNGGVGIINQTGGTATFSGDWVGIGAPGEGGPNGAGTGIYNLSGGLLDINDGWFQLGLNGGKGSLVQTGGTLTSDVNIMLGRLESPGYVGTEGTYLLSGGTATLTNGITVAASAGATGTLTQTGGLLSVTGGTIGFGAGTGTVNLNGGTLEIGGANFTGAGTLKLGGGTIRVIGSPLTTSVATTTTGGTSTINTNGFGATWNSGIVGGPGGLTKAGAGTLTLNGVNSYSGATTITGGTLALGVANALLPSSGVNLAASGARFDVTAAAQTIKGLSGVSGSFVDIGTQTLTFGDNPSTTYNGSFNGTTGGITKTGLGTFTFGGTSNFTGAVNINSGAFVHTSANALTGASAVNLASGATWNLGGAGTQSFTTPGSTVTLGGTLVATLGNGHDRITAGTVALSPGATLDLLGGDGNFALTPYELIAASTAQTGTFTGPVTDDLVFLDTAANYAIDPNKVFVTFAKSSTTLASAGPTPNAQSVGAAIDTLPITNPLFGAIATHSVPTVAAALQSMTGEFHASAKSVLFEQADNIPGSINSRFAQAFGGGGTIPLGYADDGKLAGLGVPAPAAAGPGVWAQGFGHSLDIKGGSGLSDLAAHDAGGLAGIDFGGGNWVAGAGGGYTSSSLSSDGVGSTGTIGLGHAVAYAGVEAGAVRFTGGGAYGWGDVATTRAVLLPMPQTLTANYKARVAQAFGEVSAGLGVVRPFAGANYINVATDAFTETGGSAALAAAASSQSVTFTTLGLRAQAAAGAATLNGALGWRHAFGDVAPLSSFTIQGAGFGVAGVPVAKDAFVAEAGVDVSLSKALKVGVSYSGQIAAESQEHGVRGTASLRF